MFGVEYEFSQETKVTVQHMEVAQNLVDLTESMVIVQFYYQGYVFKVPVYGYTNEDNYKA